LVEELDSDKQKSFKGTPHWMAPETIKTLESTRFSDIWSLGCTVIEMVTGDPPWSQYTNQITALYNIMNAQKPPDLPEGLSDSLKDFLSKCMKLNPRERLNVYKLLRHPFITGEELANRRESKKVNSDKNLHELMQQTNKGKDTKDNLFKNSEIRVSNINPIFGSIEKNGIGNKETTKV
jgi:serine/threonine protein kinase